MTLTVRTYQDNINGHHAVIEDGDGNTLAVVPDDRTYGTDTAAEAATKAQKLIARWDHRGLDAEGGGIK